jgi:hypothetical protein
MGRDGIIQREVWHESLAPEMVVGRERGMGYERIRLLIQQAGMD